MRLNELFPGTDDREILNVSDDSRVFKKDSIFFCIEGFTVDGHRFIDQAVANGAVAIVHTQPIKTFDHVINIQVDDVDYEVHRVTNHLLDYPSKKMTIYGVTGTNGKSTIMKTLRNVLKRLKVATGYIGTISIEYNEHHLLPSLTTPSVVELQTLLKAMVDEGIKAVCLEVSSQGLDLNRVASIDFDSAAYTNLSHDHLDYHHDMEAYFQAKKKLFDHLKPDANVIVNIDDPYGQRLADQHYSHCLTYAIDQSADYQAVDIVASAEMTEFTLIHRGIRYHVTSNLLAHYNVYNAIAVIALAHQQGYPLETIIEQLKDIEQVEGRMEKIRQGQPFSVIVDYGHSPDSYNQTLAFLKSITPEKSRLIAVFGAAGGRDPIKRPIMGSIADQHCDYIILTEQDTRNENPQDIAAIIAQGIQSTPYEYIQDRYQAMEHAVTIAGEGDTIVSLGKGNEMFIYRDYGRGEWMGDDTAFKKILKEKGYHHESIH